MKFDLFRKIWADSLNHGSFDSIFDLIEFLVNYPGYEIEELTPNYQKSNEDAERLRLKGNLCWAQYLTSHDIDDLEQSKLMYTRSIGCAESPEVLAPALTNRARVLIEQGLNIEAEKDIAYALELELEQPAKSLVLFRKAELLIKIRKTSEALEIITEIERTFSNSPVFKNDKLCSSIKILKASTKMDNNFEPKHQVFLKNEFHSWESKYRDYYVSSGKNLSYQIYHCDTEGYGLISNVDILAGSIILIDEPFGYANYSITNCSYCNKVLSSPIPCDKCAVCFFCSNKCKDQAFDVLNQEELIRTSLHKYKCGFSDFIARDDYAGLKKQTDDPKIKNLGIGGKQISSLAFSIVSKLSGKELASFIKNHPKLCYPLTGERPSLVMLNQSGFGNMFPFYLTSVIWLCDNFKNRTYHHLIQFAHQALILAKILEITGYEMFSQKESLDKPKFFNDEKPSFLQVAAFLAFFIMASSSNAHEYTHNKYYAKNINGEKYLSLNDPDIISNIGCGLFPTLSLLNHSCAPNVTRICLEPFSIAAIALRNIKKGEKLFDSYWLNFNVTPILERRKELKYQYYFDCKCIACLNDWPMNMSNLCSPVDYPGGCKECDRSASKCICPDSEKKLKEIKKFYNSLNRLIINCGKIPWSKIENSTNEKLEWIIQELSSADSFLNNYPAQYNVLWFNAQETFKALIDCCKPSSTFMD